MSELPFRPDQLAIETEQYRLTVLREKFGSPVIASWFDRFTEELVAKLSDGREIRMAHETFLALMLDYENGVPQEPPLPPSPDDERRPGNPPALGDGRP